ncbi:MAG: LON peptidase substrate-binding domain-containing protein, partial [Desulfovibrionaceae bacterium]|nr:LON peptidase substrate-binding domain-containing protein [Desulfovibrionaceae bacterium]
MSDFKFDGELAELDSPLLLPLMSLREVVMFPRSVTPLFVGRDVSIRAIESALADYDKLIFLVAQQQPDLEKPALDDLFAVGTVSRVLQLLKLPDGTIKVLFEGLYRAAWAPADEFLPGGNEFQIVQVNRIADIGSESPERDALVRAAQEAFEDYAKINKKISPEHLASITALNDPGRLADAAMPHIKVDYRKKQEVLEEADSMARLEKVYEFLQSEISIFNMEKRIK